MTEIIVKAKPSASRDAVERISDSEYIVRTTQPPVQGRANRAIINLLAEYFSVPMSHISIVAGHTSRTKHIRII